jgi:transposase
MFQKAFKEEAMSRTQVFKWFARFKRGEMSVEDHPHSGRPSSHTDENVKKIREKINEDCRYTIDEMSEGTGVSWSSCQRILIVELNMRRTATKFVPPCSHRTKKTLV